MTQLNGASLGKDSAFALAVTTAVLKLMKIGMISRGNVRDLSETQNGLAITRGRTTRNSRFAIQMSLKWQMGSRGGSDLPPCTADVFLCWLPADGGPGQWRRFTATHNLDEVRLEPTAIIEATQLFRYPEIEIMPPNDV